MVNYDFCKIMASFRTNYSLNFISYTDQPIGLQFFFKRALTIHDCNTNIYV